MFSTTIAEINIPKELFEQLEKENLCKFANDYFVIGTNITLAGNEENVIRFNVMQEMARRTGYQYLQIHI